MPTPTLDVRRRFAWENYDCNPHDGGCTRKTGRRCVDASGEPRHPHPCRIRRADDYFAGQASRDTEVGDLHERLLAMQTQLETAQQGAALVPGLQGRIAELTDKVRFAEQRIGDARIALEAEQAAHEHTRTTAAHVIADLRARVAELEQQTPPAPSRLPFGIGINEKPTGHASPLPFTRAAIEAEAGVKFAYVIEFFRFPTTGVLTSLITWCEGHLKAGRIPAPTVKVPGDDWAGAAAGKYDAAIAATADALAALVEKYRPAFPSARILLSLQNEPDNDGKPYAAFDAMVDHLEPILRRPGVIEYWLKMTGWEQLYGGDSQWDLEDLDVSNVDGVLFDPYLSLGASSSKLTDMVTAYAKPYGEWAARKKIQWGIGETGLSENAATSSIPGVRTQMVDFADGCAEHGATLWCYWNNKVAPSTSKPVTQDWRITTTGPANKLAQIVALLKKYGAAA